MVDWAPAGICALRFDASGERLALGRGSGEVEVWQVVRPSTHGARMRFHKLLCVPGRDGRDLRSLLWTPAGRLYGAGLGGEIFELDLVGLRVAYVRWFWGAGTRREREGVCVDGCCVCVGSLRGAVCVSGVGG